MTKTCARCGQPVDGYAQINDDWYCHPDNEGKPDCYSLSFREDTAAGTPLVGRYLRRGGEGETPW